MPPLKHAWVLLLNCTKISLMFATNWLYFKILPDSLKATTKKQQMTSIREYTFVCLFQNYKKMWIKRTNAKGKFLSKVVSSKTRYSQLLFDIS